MVRMLRRGEAIGAVPARRGPGGDTIDAPRGHRIGEALSAPLGGSRARSGRHAAGRIGLALLRAVGVVVVMFVLLQGYSWFRKTYFVPPSSAGYANALDIIDLQRSLGIGVDRVEIPLQQRVIEHQWLIDFFNHYYRQMKIFMFAAAALCVVLAPGAFWRIARIFLLATAIAFPMYAIYPLAPPRLMQSHGYPFVDTLAVYAGVQSSSAGAGGANQFAAMPSMHIGWTAIAALWLAASLPWRRIGAWLGALHLILMSFAVVVTGNHYVLDIVAGLMVVGAALAIDWLVFRRVREPAREPAGNGLTTASEARR
mgnify:CR=1 FL=1